jgi:hypothetical protein
VPRLLTIDQKQQRVDDLEQCLAIFNRNKDEFYRRYITIDQQIFSNLKIKKLI